LKYIKFSRMKNFILNLKNLLSEAVKSEIGQEKKIGVVFSGGIDSAIISFLSHKFCEVINYTVGTDDSEDVVFAKKFKNALLNLKDTSLNFINTKIVVVTEKEIEKEIDNILKILKENNIEITKLNLSTAIPVYFAAKNAKNDKINVMLSGQGADEIFGGYARYLKMGENERINAMKNDINNAYKDNLNRDIAMCKFHDISLKFPYMDKNFLDYAINIPLELKIYEVKNDELTEFKETIDVIDNKKFIRKFILRKLGQEIGVPEFIVKRKKKAMQYGSKSEKIVEKILKRLKI